MSGTYGNPTNNLYSTTYGEHRAYSHAPTYTAYSSQYQNIAYPSHPTTYSTVNPNNPSQAQTYQLFNDSNPATYGEQMCGYKPVTGQALELPGQRGSSKRGGFNPRMPFSGFKPRRGGGVQRGGGGKWPHTGYREKVPKPFSCSKRHPISALKHLYPKAEFTAVCSYNVNKGSAHVYSVVIENVVYQGEGTTSKIAKAIAATKALEGIQAPDYDKVDVVADYAQQKEEVMRRIADWQAQHFAKEEKKRKQKEEKEKDENQHKDKKVKVDITPEAVPIAIGPVKPIEKTSSTEVSEATAATKEEVKDYGQLRHRYGPNITEEFTENLQGPGMRFSCTLTIQGFQFTGENSSKKKARNEAVRLAFLAFEASPPPVVHIKRERTPRAPKKFDPVEFPDKLAEKCWNFASDVLGEVQGTFKQLKNLVFVVKMEGEESVENCEIVSFGHGTRLILMANMVDDGSVIEDCTGDSLALRGLRRYLITQIDAFYRKEPSIYVSTTNNMLKIREDIQFLFYSTNCPNGDCRTYTITHRNFKRFSRKGGQPEPEKQEEVEGNEEKDAVDVGFQSKARIPIQKRRTKTFEGKITYAKKDDLEGSKENIGLYEEAVSHCIVSPSDKLAMRTISGVQGSLLSGISSPVFLSQFLITLNKFNIANLLNSIHGRVAESNIPESWPKVTPKVRGIKWRPTEFLPKTSLFACIWAKGFEVEILYSVQGKKFDGGLIDFDWSKPVGTDIFSPSSYCTNQLFQELQTLCRKHKLPCPRKYSEIKLNMSADYQSVRSAVKEHLETTGKGNWLVKREPNY